MKQPLSGRRILITRATHQAGRLQSLLEAAGAEAIAIPTIEIVPPDSYAALDAALTAISSYDWLVLTSVNGVEAMAARAGHLGLDIHALSACSIAAIGKATAESIRALGLEIDLVPAQAVAESLAAALAPLVVNKNVLILRATVARDTLPASLKAAGASVTIAEAYQTLIPPASLAALRSALVTQIDAVTFTSASSANNFFALVEAAGLTLPQQTKIFSIGPITSAALKEAGRIVDAEAQQSTMEALVNAVTAVFDLTTKEELS